MNASASPPVALSPLHHAQVELGAEMALIDGWLRPARHGGADEELAAMRSAVGVCDVSPIGKLSLQGTGMDALLSNAFPDSRLPAVGRAVRVDDETVVARLAHDEALLTTTAGRPERLGVSTADAGDVCAHVVDVTSALAAVRVAGPRAPDLLAALTELDVSADAFPDASCAQSRFAEIHGTLVRLEAAGMPGYTLLFGREYGDYMWESMMEAGERYGLVPFGIEALSRLR